MQAPWRKGLWSCPVLYSIPGSRYLMYTYWWYEKYSRGRTAGEIPRRGSRVRPRPGPQLPPGPPGSAMIKAILIFNNQGKPRLSKFYQPYSEDTQQQIIRETLHLVSKRDENVCNFLEGGLLIGGSDNKLIYRHCATLYFVFCVDSSESELGILDLIQVSHQRKPFTTCIQI